MSIVNDILQIANYLTQSKSWDFDYLKETVFTTTRLLSRAAKAGPLWYSSDTRKQKAELANFSVRTPKLMSNGDKAI